MIFWYTARNKFNETITEGFSWQKYIEWSKLLHLKELISLDSSLCDLAFEIDYEEEKLYDYLITDESSSTAMFNNLDFVISRVKNKSNVNLLTVVKEPNEECKFISLANFTFIGYDLIDQSYDNSALSNCGGFDETFLPQDLNEFGLISNFQKAISIQQNLIANNPEERHADCNLFAIWRHI